jgi:hypothetical protein
MDGGIGPTFSPPYQTPPFTSMNQYEVSISGTEQSSDASYSFSVFVSSFGHRGIGGLFGGLYYDVGP